MMTLLIIAYLGGALTILSPCILPILPFVFARAGQPFIRSTLPMLTGMAATFALVATLAAVGGSWAIHANEYGRFAAIVLLAIFGVSLLSPRIASMVARPVVDFGNSLLNASDKPGSAPTAASSLILGVATGLLWAPCAGPILGLVLTGAALQGANIQTTLLLVAYAAGAATSLALALIAGGRMFAALKQSLGISERIRQVLGAAILAGVAAIALGLDTGFWPGFPTPVLPPSNRPYSTGCTPTLPPVRDPRLSAMARPLPPPVQCSPSAAACPTKATRRPSMAPSNGLTRRRSLPSSCAARSSLSISGPIPASIASAPRLMCAPGLRNTRNKGLW